MELNTVVNNSFTKFDFGTKTKRINKIKLIAEVKEFNYSFKIALPPNA
jgi:hypothetical protein